jgi:hypothetical protein
MYPFLGTSREGSKGGIFKKTKKPFINSTFINGIYIPRNVDKCQSH